MIAKLQNTWTELEDALQGVELHHADAETEARRWFKIRATLEEIHTYEDDWDGMGAEAPTEEQWQSALQFADGLKQLNIASPHRVVAGPTGSFVFEWQSTGFHLSVEIEQPFLAEWMLVKEGQPVRHWTSK